jgi:hypothetical protein
MKRSATPAEPAPVSAHRCAGAPGARLWAFVGMLLVMAGAMVGLGLTG